jgi:ADP-heptose:LPS heptosyltransferase
LRIGIVWAGSPTHIRDHERSIPLEVLAPALTKINADFYAPFIGAALDEIGTLPIQRLDNLITDFADTAALLNQMDCLITVDTSVAHLAGTLGLKTFLLLHHCPDWRWETSASTTAWYPSLTLLRQSRFGDWSSVVSRLTKLLSPASDL